MGQRGLDERVGLFWDIIKKALKFRPALSQLVRGRRHKGGFICLDGRQSIPDSYGTRLALC